MMLTTLVDSAIRSIALGAGTWAILKVLRVRQPEVRMTVWSVVLGISLAMPVLTPWVRVPIPATFLTGIRTALPSMHTDRWAVIPGNVTGARAPVGGGEIRPEPEGSQTQRHSVDWAELAFVLYTFVAALLLLRLIQATRLMLRIVRAALPVRDPSAPGIDLRVSDVVTVPVTFRTTILVPPSYVDWSEQTFRAVMLHETSHVAHRDFYVLWLAALNRAVFWFNPGSWWLRRHLADLAEMVSDDAVMRVLPSRRSYADILLEMAGLPERAPAGLAMAQPSTVQWRVQRILTAPAPHVSLSSRKRMLIVLASASIACLSAGTFESAGSFELEAHTHSPELISSLDRLSGGIHSEQTNLEQANLEQADRVRAGELQASLARRAATTPDRFRDQSPLPGGATVLRKTLNDLRLGTLDYAAMSGPLADKLRERWPRWQPMLEALGEPVSIRFEAVGAGGFDRYAVQFTHGWSEFPLDLTPDGKLDYLGFDPGGDGTPGAIEDCSRETSLDSSHETAPIRLSLVNRSGADLRLFELDATGRRVAQGKLHADGGARWLLTYVHHPFVITDASGSCREIILPGLATRVHVIQAPGLSTTRRSTQLPGSDRMLRQYIEGIQRGTPLYEQMTPAAELIAHLRLRRQSDILAKLGTLETISFHGVNEIGGDRYTVRFANGVTEWHIRMSDEGRIAQIALEPLYER